MEQEVLRLEKNVYKNIGGTKYLLSSTIIYAVKNGRQITTSDREIIVLPRKTFNKKGKFEKIIKECNWIEYTLKPLES